MSEPRKNAEKTQPYSSIPPSSCETIGITVEMASASKPMSVTVSTRPVVSARRSGRHRLSARSRAGTFTLQGWPGKRRPATAVRRLAARTFDVGVQSGADSLGGMRSTHCARHAGDSNGSAQ